MKEISPTGRDFQSLTLEKCICNPRITLLPLYLSFVPSVSPEGTLMALVFETTNILVY